MASEDPIDRFVRDGLSQGRTRKELEGALAEAGWTRRDIDKALAKYVDTPFSPPVPRPTYSLTARDTFLYALLFTSMAFTASYLVTLVHAVIDMQIFDPSDLSPNYAWAERSIRWAAASLTVSTPLFVWLSVHVARRAAEDEGIRRSPVRKWLTYVALFVSVMIFFGDAVVTIYNLLQGEVTLRFALKAATVAAVSGTVFLYYLRDVEERSDAR